MSIVTRSLLTVLLSLSLMACSKSSVRPTTPPEPPRVDCTLGSTPEPARPLAWDLEGLSVALADALGVLRQERVLRYGERACINQLKQGGVIR